MSDLHKNLPDTHKTRWRGWPSVGYRRRRAAQHQRVPVGRQLDEYLAAHDDLLCR